jgi:magnesium chelatase family protein
MLATTRTFTLEGISARPVRVEVDVHRGLPSFAIVGLPDAAVHETRERVRAALVNCGFEFPLRRIVVSLAPASLRKAGPGMDLAIAAALLSASGQLHWEGSCEVALVGELALDGSTRPVNGALPISEAARDGGAKTIVIPAENGSEAALAAGIGVIPLDSLARLRAVATGNWKPPRPAPLPLCLEPAPGAPDLAELRGQYDLRLALEVAAAGGHSLLMVGPPGAGKSLAAARLPSILPPLSAVEGLEVARIASACGRLGSRSGGRPLRAPHHTISAAGLIGGGVPARPGEVTLAHRGILFLDELSAFRRDTLEALRSPMETGEVWIAGRARKQHGLPSRFMMVAAADPCPCGRGEADPDCACEPHDVQRHHARLNAAPADRIDIAVAVRPPTAEEIAGPPGEPSATARERIIAARERQEHRLGPGRCNAQMTSAEARSCPLSADAAAAFAGFYSFSRPGALTHDSALRLAQTIADMRGLDEVGEEQVFQALLLRRALRG